MVLLIIKGTNTVMLRGPKSREALRHFGKACGTKGSHAKPYTRTRHSEIARGRWSFCWRYYKYLNHILYFSFSLKSLNSLWTWWNIKNWNQILKNRFLSIKNFILLIDQKSSPKSPPDPKSTSSSSCTYWASYLAAGLSPETAAWLPEAAPPKLIDPTFPNPEAIT